MVYQAGSFSKTERVPAPSGEPGGTIEWMISQEELGRSGRCFTRVNVLPGAEIPVHFHHGEFEIFYVAKGSGVYIDDGMTVRVHEGDAMYCAAEHQHGLVNDGADTIVLIAFIGYHD